MSTRRIEDVVAAPPLRSGAGPAPLAIGVGDPAPLLTAKLAAVAQPGTALLPRPRLFALLDAGAAGPVTLVSASAGWGKTVLLSSWYRAREAAADRTGGRPQRAALGWLSLEPGDGGARLWSYLHAALRPDVAGPEDRSGPEPDAGYQPTSGYGPEHLADELARRPEPATLVLDDLHLVDDPEVSSGLEFLLRHAAGRLRLVIGCRTDPALALHRWRLSGELTEIRAADLAFRADEVTELFAGYGVPLPAEQVRGLLRRTEGWPAGLRFAALALPGQPDPGRFVEEFTGEHPEVADYLSEELLAGLPGGAREALCRAALLPGFSADLLDTLTDRTDGDRLLTELDRHGGLVIPLGGRPAAYRCHPMLAELLRAELARRPGRQLAGLHRRAATWFAANDLPGEALRHALAAQDWTYAITVLLRHWPDLVPYGQPAPTRSDPPPVPEPARAEPELWLAYAADALAGSDPVLAAGYLDRAAERAGALDDVRRDRFRRAASALRLAVAERTGDEPAVRAAAAELLPGPAPGSLTGPAAELLPGRAPGSPSGPVEPLDGRAEPFTGPAGPSSGPVGGDPGRAEEERWGRVVARLVPAASRFGAGEPLAVEPELADVLIDATRAGLTRAGRLCLGRLALSRAIRGELGAAEEAARSVLAGAPLGGLGRPADGVHAHLGQALVALHRDRAADAESNLQLAARSAEDAEEPLVVALIGIISARLFQDRGELARAHQALADSRRRLSERPDPDPLTPWLLAAEAELRIAHGDAELARDLLLPAVRRDVVPAGPVAVALSRAYLCAGDARAALRTLPDRDPPAGVDWPLPVRLEAGLLDAAAARLTGDHRRAARSLERVLRLAEPEGFRRVFIRADPPVRDLLAAHLDTGTAFWPLVSELLDATDGAGRPVPVAAQVLAEPLTERELTVLRYLQSILSNVEIAAEMSLSVNTIKTHVRNIYRKLDATRRRDAVRRARELNLI